MVTRGEWDLTNIEIIYNNVTSDETAAQLTYTVRKHLFLFKPVCLEWLIFFKTNFQITIVRKPLLYVINLIVPLFYLLVLDLASFFISEARGEKLSFKVTVLLSISVLLLILQDMLPSTEDSLPMIGGLKHEPQIRDITVQHPIYWQHTDCTFVPANYCIAIFALVGISVLEAMLVSFLIDLDGNCSKKAQRSADAEVKIELEVGCNKGRLSAKNS